MFFLNKSELTGQWYPMGAMGMKSAFFPADLERGAIGGCIMQSPGYEPSATGTLVYLNVGEDLAVALSKVETAGGKVLLPKTRVRVSVHARARACVRVRVVCECET